jgi:hypothetical protein
MSQTTDFYPSWLGNNAFGASGIRLRDQEPLIFRPTDISGCVMWLNATNNFAVTYNDLLVVTSWSNDGTLGGQFDLSGGVIVYGNALQNGLNTVTFNSNAFMSGQFQFDFQARSLFVVTRETGVGTGTPSPWITSDTNGAMESLSQHNGTTVYFIGRHNSVFPELAAESSTDYTNYAAVFSFVNAADLSDNYVGINGTSLPLSYATVASNYATASATYFLGDFLSGAPVGNSQDMCELILYNTALNSPDRENVEKYLRRKWGITEPPPAPPAPFTPTDIAGLYVWMDANNQSTVTVDGSNQVLSWSNLGLASNVFSNDSNYATYGQDANSNYVVSLPTQTTLASYVALPYVTRTNFIVFLNVSDYTTLSYPYGNLFVGDASAGVQMGVSYDSNTAISYMSMCQAGINCPVGAPITLPVGGYNLMIMASDSNTTSNTLAYFNGGSNINTSTDLGNLFNTNPIPYIIGSPVSDSPSFRLAEVLEYDSLLSSTDISTVAGYLVTKWAISSFVPLS